MFHYFLHPVTNLDTKSGESVGLSDDKRHENLDVSNDEVINNSNMIENIDTEENDDTEADDIENEDITENYGENVEVEENSNNWLTTSKKVQTAVDSEHARVARSGQPDLVKNRTEIDGEALTQEENIYNDNIGVGANTSS